jgi:hypothetical protein
MHATYMHEVKNTLLMNDVKNTFLMKDVKKCFFLINKKPLCFKKSDSFDINFAYSRSIDNLRASLKN